MIQAFCFDMDGLLFDTERLGERVMYEAAERQGVTMAKEQWRELVGANLATTQQKLLLWFHGKVDGERFTEDWCNIMLEHIHREGMPFMPGAQEVLPALRVRGMKLALCTSNARNVVQEYLDIAGIPDAFDVIVTGDMVAHGKPAPDIFLKAAELMSLSPKDCVGVEDSVNGVKAIRAAGMRSVMVPDLLPYGSEVADDVDICLNSLNALEQAIFG